MQKQGVCVEGQGLRAGPRVSVRAGSLEEEPICFGVTEPFWEQLL